MKFSITFLFLLCTATVFSQTGEVMTNKTIIDLEKVGLGKEVLKSKIQSSPCNFDLSTDGLISLKKAGVPDDIITAMLSKSTAPSTTAATVTSTIPTNSGIYYVDSTTNNYIEFDPSILTNQKSGGLGEVLKQSVSGLFNAKQRASLSGTQAHTQFNTATPVFLFVFDTAAKGFSNSNTLFGTVQSPNEFFLVKMKVEKRSREIVVGKENSIKSDIGIDDDIKVAFTSKKLRKGAYEVTPAFFLKSGEYCFMFAASSMYGGQSHKVYDFSVK